MEYYIKIVTPGSHLSTDTLFTLVAELRTDFEKSIQEAISEEFPQAGKNKLREGIKRNISFEFQEMRRGSWEIIFDGALGQFVGKLLYDIAKDIGFKHPSWEALRTRLYAVMKKCADHIKRKEDTRKEIGPYFIQQMITNIEPIENGDSRIVIEMQLTRKNDSPTYSTSEEVEAALKSFFNDEFQDPEKRLN